VNYRNSTASLGTELATLEEAVLQRDSDNCSVAVGNIAEIARSAYESACVQRDALQGFLSRLEGELAESEQALRRKKPLAKVLSIGSQQFTAYSCSPLPINAFFALCLLQWRTARKLSPGVEAQ
jgi:hypothetical protein